ncbi:MAG: hypothetical protein AAGI34_17305 [Pseudomonadota bacterium]
MSLIKFAQDETGSAALDWVALAAGIVILGLAVVYGVFQSSVSQLTRSINEDLIEIEQGAVSKPSSGAFSGNNSGEGENNIDSETE